MDSDSESLRWPSLQCYISKSGHCSRRKAAELIEKGKVEVDGAICRIPWQPIKLGQRVKANGVGILSHKPKHLLYLALHKPPGYLTTNLDPDGRPCAIKLIQPIYSERLFHVGRLDKNSSGLIFFTNDGDFAQAVQHPSKVMEREYEVKTRKRIPEFVMQHWKRGIEIDGIRYTLKNYQMLGHREVRLVLTEGLNREIRRVFEHFHIPLKRVHRLRIGTVKLRGLASGEFRSLKGFEINALQAGKNPLLVAESAGLQRSRQSDQAGGERGQDCGTVTEPQRKQQGNYSSRKGATFRSENQQGLYNKPSSPYRACARRLTTGGTAKQKSRQQSSNPLHIPSDAQKKQSERFVRNRFHTTNEGRNRIVLSLDSSTNKKGKRARNKRKGQEQQEYGSKYTAGRSEHKGQAESGWEMERFRRRAVKP